MRVLLLGNGVLADALAGALLASSGATLVGVLHSPPYSSRLLRDRTDRLLQRRLARAGVRHAVCEGTDRPAFAHLLDALAPELVLVATWPERIHQTRLDASPARWVNCHPSLLPRWRGANPYAAAILAGDGESGVSFHCMDAGLDTGGVLLRETVPVRDEDTGGDLRQRCAQAASALLPALIELLGAAPDARGTPQSRLGQSSRCPRLRAADARLDLQLPAVSLARRVRAVQPWLAPWLTTGKRMPRLHVGRAVVGPPDDSTRPPGTVLWRARGEVGIKTGCGGSLRVSRFALDRARLPLPARIAAALLAAGRS